MNPFQQARLQYKPQMPWQVHHVVGTKERAPDAPLDIKKSFENTADLPLIRFEKGERRKGTKRNVGVLFSGGQAPGGHNVVAGLLDALSALHEDSKLFGFLGGPSGIINGKYRELHPSDLAKYRNTGGFDLIGSGRTKIEKEEQFASCLKTALSLQLDGLVIIGGDDSHTNAAFLAEYFKKQESATCVIGVPKTIDGDLQSAFVDISFGFDTACKTYAELISNIERDCLSAKKYTHFIKLMGRSASHIALECALQTRPNLTLIAEEIASKKMGLVEIGQMIADLVMKRAALGKHYSVILIPEGLIEFISLDQPMPKEIEAQLAKEKDPHGNLQVSLIDTHKLIMAVLQEELKKRKFEGPFSLLAHSFGYEGRSAFPSNFDANYCYTLGAVAALLVEERATGVMCFVQHLHQEPSQWCAGGVPIVSLMDFEVRAGKRIPVVKKTLVDLNKKPFKTFASQREAWALEDHYRFVGPIQFFGPKEITDSVPITVALSQEADVP